MSGSALLRVPVELRPEGSPLRWWRACCEVSSAGLLFPRALPGAMDGRVLARFHLPSVPPPTPAGLPAGYEEPAPPPGPAVTVTTRVVVVDPDPDSEASAARGPEPRALRFLDLDGPSAERIGEYVAARPWL